MDQISGFIEIIIFTNPENGFTVARLQESEKKELTCIVGILSSIRPGETIQCSGNWKNHPSYGKQFQVSSYSLTYPATILGIQKYLESGLIKGIGPIYAKNIIDLFGEKTLEVIDNNPNRLLEVPGIGKKRLSIIKQCFIEQKSIRTVMVFLQGQGISPAYAQKIYKRYGDHSIQKVQENPYDLAREIVGIGFKTADQIAQNLGFAKDSSLRIVAGIEHVLWELTNEGHTCFPEKELVTVAAKILDLSAPLIQENIDTMVPLQRLIRRDKEGFSYIWLPSLFHTEMGIAQELLRLDSATCILREVDSQKALDWLQQQIRIKLAKDQITAIQQGVQEKLHIITGGPGTGKSTITKAIIQITEMLSKNILLAAPTGRAAKRMTQITHKKAFTIHSLLEWDFRTGGFNRNHKNPLKADLIILDEASMIDTSLMYYFLRAVPSHARVILIGDVDQLPSVGPGYVLADLIRSEKISTTHLTKIFRQAHGSAIISNAHKINAGYFPDLHMDERSDFLFIEKNEPEEIEKTIVELMTQKLPQEKNFHPIEDVQVLSPMKRGNIGIIHLNSTLQNVLNPSSSPLFVSGQRLHLYDKVMQIKNNYQKNVFNGDVGSITAIDMEEQNIEITFDERKVCYEFFDLDEIALAYAVSVHKFQGSECPCIIIPFHTCHYMLLQKNLLYTAITRGKQLVIIIGTKKALAIAIHNKKTLQRHTGLQEMIAQHFSKLISV
ncbi:MAG: ATP-dependent RecD-like DNA helicase [Parachlamydiales bacterium]|nr:ATP-dependent RecD-like DNA helicase [Parachlamydiales bacterium]